MRMFNKLRSLSRDPSERGGHHHFQEQKASDTSDSGLLQVPALLSEHADQGYIISPTTTPSNSLVNSSSINNFIAVPSPPSQNSNPQGLTLVHDSKASTADLIFVHGLGGSSWNTWCWDHNPELFWPAWLKHEKGASHFRVFTFGYDANFRGPDRKLGILDFARSLLVRMSGYGHASSEERPIGERPIIFVAHSMGGLVVKKASISRLVKIRPVARYN
ncbi:hypothetical protein VTI74DRAFT_4725 [Chaetomium olivicolor]